MDEEGADARRAGGSRKETELLAKSVRTHIWEKYVESSEHTNQTRLRLNTTPHHRSQRTLCDFDSTLSLSLSLSLYPGIPCEHRCSEYKWQGPNPLGYVRALSVILTSPVLWPLLVTRRHNVLLSLPFRPNPIFAAWTRARRSSLPIFIYFVIYLCIILHPPHSPSPKCRLLTIIIIFIFATGSATAPPLHSTPRICIWWLLFVFVSCASTLVIFGVAVVVVLWQTNAIE